MQHYRRLTNQLAIPRRNGAMARRHRAVLCMLALAAVFSASCAARDSDDGAQPSAANIADKVGVKSPTLAMRTLDGSQVVKYSIDTVVVHTSSDLNHQRLRTLAEDGYLFPKDVDSMLEQGQATILIAGHIPDAPDYTYDLYGITVVCRVDESLSELYLVEGGPAVQCWESVEESVRFVELDENTLDFEVVIGPVGEDWRTALLRRPFNSKGKAYSGSEETHLVLTAHIRLPHN